MPDSGNAAISEARPLSGRVTATTSGLISRGVFCLVAMAVILVLAISVPSSGNQSDLEGMSPRVLIPSPPEHEAPAKDLYPTFWGSAPDQKQGSPCRDAGKCVTCHETHATMDAPHAVACVRCHGGDPTAEDEKQAHEGLMRDPGDLRFAERTCGACHPEEVKRVRRSAMALAPRMINHVRFAFGAQESPEPTHATVEREGLKQVPHPSLSSSLGDDLLRRSCLRCHLHTRGSQRWGEHRGQGCSACHIAYPNSADGKPRTHAIVRDAGLTACLKCHNANHVGADYVGLFEKDAHRGFRSPISGGTQPPRIYGSEQHRLVSDVHFKAGMECMDCHTLDEVHGTGELPTSPVAEVSIRCESCHVRGDHPAVLKSDEGMTLLRGPSRKVPAWNPDLVPHRVEEHRSRLRCTACHAAWSFQDYGLHLMREERADYGKWSTTAAQNDPQIQELLQRNVGTEAELIPPPGPPVSAKPGEQWPAPATSDWLSGETRPGAWFRAYTIRLWSSPPLGLDHEGKVSIMRPMYQYVVSHVGADEQVLLDNEVPTTGKGVPALLFNPYAPHTTSAKGRACHECHGNPKAAGLGDGFKGIAKPAFQPLWRPETRMPVKDFRWDALVDEQGNALQRSSHPGAGPLDKDTVSRLMRPSDRQKALHYRYLQGKGAAERP